MELPKQTALCDASQSACTLGTRPHHSRASWGEQHPSREDVEETQGRGDSARPLLKHRGEAKGLSWNKQGGSSSLSPSICGAARASASLHVGPRHFTNTSGHFKSSPNSLPQKSVRMCVGRAGLQLCSPASPRISELGIIYNHLITKNGQRAASGGLASLPLASLSYGALTCI